MFAGLIDASIFVAAQASGREAESFGLLSTLIRPPELPAAPAFEPPAPPPSIAVPAAPADPPLFVHPPLGPASSSLDPQAKKNPNIISPEKVTASFAEVLTMCLLERHVGVRCRTNQRKT